MKFDPELWLGRLLLAVVLLLLGGLLVQAVLAVIWGEARMVVSRNAMALLPGESRAWSLAKVGLILLLLGLWWRKERVPNAIWLVRVSVVTLIGGVFSCVGMVLTRV
ncbi:hypothetical protein [Derxia lacustris]|uniref:hypothetical protein n=1 Tax=Derxia lacustris TaxID=764842 RepID=UPI000A16DBFA|nr:hypothetical protein [Derxia lacustris]